MINEKKDACYSKVKSRYSVWPSAYASGALVKCRKVGAANWGNKSKKKNESILNTYAHMAYMIAELSLQILRDSGHQGRFYDYNLISFKLTYNFF